MTGEANKEIVRRSWEQCFNRGNMAIVDELVADTFAWHGPGMEINGREGITQLLLAFRNAFPDLEWIVEDQIAEGDRVATRWIMRGTHEGTLFGISPTHKKVTITGIVLSRIANGQIDEEWESFDQLGMLQQLGAVPTPEPAST